MIRAAKRCTVHDSFSLSPLPARYPFVARKSRKVNPFYPLLVLVGLAFAITACGFALMMVRGINPTNEVAESEPNGLLLFFQEHGFTALMIELAVLALATLAAITTDELWADRVEVGRRGERESSSPPATTEARNSPPEDEP